MEDTKELTVIDEREEAKAKQLIRQQGGSIFTNMVLFEDAQRIATLMASADYVPKNFKGNIPNTLIALEIAGRTGSSALAVMQNLYIVHGNPSWSATYIIAAINASGRFSPLRFNFEGEGDERTCRACATDNQGNELEGPPVSIAIAKKEGWFQKNGSKWKTMPELMMRYRAATFFGRLYAPEILMGMKTADEQRDIGYDKIEDPAKDVNDMLESHNPVYNPIKLTEKERLEQNAMAAEIEAEIKKEKEPPKKPKIEKKNPAEKVKPEEVGMAEQVKKSGKAKPKTEMNDVNIELFDTLNREINKATERKDLDLISEDIKMIEDSHPDFPQAHITILHGTIETQAKKIGG